jgi:hypothetical protein
MIKTINLNEGINTNVRYDWDQAAVLVSNIDGEMDGYSDMYKGTKLFDFYAELCEFVDITPQSSSDYIMVGYTYIQEMIDEAAELFNLSYDEGMSMFCLNRNIKFSEGVYEASKMSIPIVTDNFDLLNNINTELYSNYLVCLSPVYTRRFSEKQVLQCIEDKELKELFRSVSPWIDDCDAEDIELNEHNEVYLVQNCNGKLKMFRITLLPKHDSM